MSFGLRPELAELDDEVSSVRFRAISAIASVRACGIEVLAVGNGDECMGPDGVDRPVRADKTVVIRLQKVFVL